MGVENETEADHEDYYFAQRKREYENTIENQNRMISTLKRQSKHFEDLNRENMSKTNEMLFKLRCSEQEILRMKRIVEKYDNDIARVKREMDNLRNENNATSEHVLFEAQKLKIKYEKLSQLQLNLEKEHEELQQELATKSNQSAQEIENISSAAKQQKQELENQLSTVQEELASAIAELTYLKELGLQSKTSLEHLMRENKNLQTENECLRKNKEETEALRMELERLKNCLEEATSREDTKERIIEELKSQNEWIKNELEPKTKQDEDLLKKKDAEIEKLTKSLKMEMDERNILLGNYLKNSEVLKSELVVARNLVEEVSAENKELKDSLLSMRNENSESCSTFNEVEVQVEFEKTLSEYRNMKKSLEDFRERNRLLEEDLDMHRAMVENLGRENCGLKREKIVLGAQCEKLKKSLLVLDTVEARLSYFEGTKENLQSSVTKLEASFTEISQSLQKFWNQKMELVREANKSFCDIQSKMQSFKVFQEEFMQEKNAFIKDTYEKLLKEYDLSRSKLRIMQNEHQLKSNEVDILSKRFSDLLDVQRKTEKCIADLHRDKIDLRKRVLEAESSSFQKQEELALRMQQMENLKLENELKQIGVEQFLRSNGVLKNSLDQLRSDVERNAKVAEAMEEEIKQCKIKATDILDKVKGASHVDDKRKVRSKRNKEEIPVKKPREESREPLGNLLGKLNKNNLELKFVIHLLKKGASNVTVAETIHVGSEKVLARKEEEEMVERQRVRNIGFSTEIMTTNYEENEQDNKAKLLQEVDVVSLSRKSISVPELNGSSRESLKNYESYVKNQEATTSLCRKSSVVNTSSNLICVKKCSSVSSISSRKSSRSKTMDRVNGMSMSKNMEHLEIERGRWFANMKTLHQLRTQVQDIRSKLAQSRKCAKKEIVCDSLNMPLSTLWKKKEIFSPASTPKMPEIVADFQEQVKKLFVQQQSNSENPEIAA